MRVIDLEHVPVMTLLQKPSWCSAGGVWENAVSSPSGAIILEFLAFLKVSV